MRIECALVRNKIPSRAPVAAQSKWQLSAGKRKVPALHVGHATALNSANTGIRMEELSNKMRRAAADAFMSSFEPMIARASTALTARETTALRGAVRLWAHAMLEAPDAGADERKWFAGFGGTTEEREMLVFLFKSRDALVPPDHQRFADRVIKALESRILELTIL